jgi:tetratricopeptide (TPR) repeat protein
MMISMYLRGSRWSMARRTRRRGPNLWVTSLLLVAVGVMVYVQQVIVPVTPPLFIPTPTVTRSPESFVNQAQEFVREAKYPQAIEAYEAAIRADPDNPSNYIELARLQVWTGEHEKAVLNTQNALIENPNNPLALAVQGWARGFQRQYGEAERLLQQALSLDNNSALAHAYYAEVLIARRDYGLYDKASAESKRALELDATIVETHRARGIVLLNTQNFEEAVESLQRAIAINKNIGDLYLLLGVAYKGLDDMPLAEEAFLQAIAYNPTNTDPLIELSRAYFQQGRYEQSAQYAEQAISINPANPRLHGDLGVALYKTGKYGRAAAELALAVRGGSLDDGTQVSGLPLDYDYRIMAYYWYYGFALANNNQCQEAVPVFQALLNGVRDDENAVYNANYGLDMCRQNMEGGVSP